MMPQAWSSRQRGHKAERRAESWLKRRGLHTLARNWHCRHGELDLVMQDESSLVFVEVRQRVSDNYGGAAASVTATKQRRLVNAANAFLASRPELSGLACRFDVLAIEGTGATATVQWIQHAFFGEH